MGFDLGSIRRLLRFVGLVSLFLMCEVFAVDIPCVPSLNDLASGAASAPR